MFLNMFSVLQYEIVFLRYDVSERGGDAFEHPVLTVVFFKYVVPFVFSSQVPLIVPILFVISAAFIVILSFWKDTLACVFGLIIALIGVPIYIVFVVWFWRQKPKSFSETMGKSMNCLHIDPITI